MPDSLAGKSQPAAPSALVLLRDTRGSALLWARRGLLPVTVAPGLAWTVVVPTGPARTAAPYDDPLTVFGGRPVPRRLRPAACLVVSDDRLAVQVQAASWRAPRRWLVWARGIGLSDYRELEPAPPALVARLLAPTRDSGQRLAGVLSRDNRMPAQVADELLTALALPGAGILTGRVDATTLPGAVAVEPSDRQVDRFDDYAADELAARRDRGEEA